MGRPTWKWKWRRLKPIWVFPQPAPIAHRLCQNSMGTSLPGLPKLTGTWPSLMGTRPPPGFSGTPMISGEISGLGQTPAIRQAPPLHFGGTWPSPNMTMATITSHTVPGVTMVSYANVSATTTLGRPISSVGTAQSHQASAPMGHSHAQWSGSILQGVQRPYTQGTSEIPPPGPGPQQGFPRGSPYSYGAIYCPNYGTGLWFIL